ncbi:hypothetical protein DPMN_101006 [Dreissena polymorpha]|uniref:Uncharacterized protein n=1 Tax=Dreissena polymorpha TaxID=45954 RepID=A0A9D4LGW8_DREPO|nr:hypothetical protein DPMN_101006 [Dreissena polymorpha]
MTFIHSSRYVQLVPIPSYPVPTEPVLSQFDYVRTHFFFIRCAVVTRLKAVLTPSYYVLSTLRTSYLKRSANGVGLSENGLDGPETDSICVASYRYIDHDSQMTPIDFEVTRSKVKVTDVNPLDAAGDAMVSPALLYGALA